MFLRCRVGIQKPISYLLVAGSVLISTVAGIDQSPGFSGDGGPATQAQINDPGELAVAPDGAVLFVDIRNARIRRIGVDGVITTVAGTGEPSETVGQ